MSWLVPELVVRDALSATLAEVRAAYVDDTIPLLLERVYGNVTPALRADLERWLAEHDVPIVMGFPRDEQVTPCWVVLVNPEDLSGTYVGDAYASEVGPYGEHLLGTAQRWSCTIGILTYSENADLTRWLYDLAKWGLASRRQQLAALFPHGQRMSGRDLDPVRLGDGGGRLTYRRALTLVGELDQTDAVRVVVDITADADAAGVYSSTVNGESLSL